MEAGAIGDKKQGVSEDPDSWARGDFFAFFQKGKEEVCGKIKALRWPHRRSEERLSGGARWGR